jgi:hypothetical protein
MSLRPVAIAILTAMVLFLWYKFIYTIITHDPMVVMVMYFGLGVLWTIVLVLSE